MVHVTQHAIDRYVERIDGSLSDEQARAAIERPAPAIRAAAAFGCRTIIRGRVKFVLEGENVVTVLVRGQFAVFKFPKRRVL